MGQQLAAEADNSMTLIASGWPNGYITALGNQLAGHAPGHRYPYEFKIVDDTKLNSIALPGGFIYVTTGLIEAAKTEPELAGLIAHQIAHVALRHGTQRVSRAYSAALPSVRSVDVDTAMAELNIGFNSNEIVKNTAEAERQADIVAAQILHDARFDPRQMALFMQQMGNQYRDQSSEFFSDHPGVQNRAARVRRELQNMGGLPSNLRGDSPDLRTTQQYLRSENGNNTESASSRLRSFRGQDLEFRYPENWSVTESGDNVFITPANGIVSGSLAYGMTIALFDPEAESFGQAFESRDSASQRSTLSSATRQLIEDLQRSNPNMKVKTGERRRVVDGESALTLELTNDSPLGGSETDWLVTVLRPDGLLYYFVGVAPRQEFSRFMPTFEQIIDSVRFYD
jgi:hypothetical protein